MPEPNFTPPEGINFSCFEELQAADLSRVLSSTVSFIQEFDPYVILNRYDDWWEHDGLHFYRKPISFDGLFSMVSSPKSMLEAMSGDFNVFIGIAPRDNSWYLRFYLDWDDTETSFIGRFDVTFADNLAAEYKNKVLSPLSLTMKEQPAEEYYREIIL